MSSIIRIKRSSSSGAPGTLGTGELAYSSLAGTQSNGGDRLYIGVGVGVGNNALDIVPIGGKYFTSRLDHVEGTLTASSAIIVDGNKKIDDLLIDNLELNGNTISSTDTNGNILLTPTGTGKTVISNPYISDTSTSLAEYIYDTVGGAITAGSGISVTNSDVNNTSTISVDNTVALKADVHYIGTTSVALNRTSANLALTGISSVTLPGSTSGTVQLIPTAAVGTGTILTIPATTGTIITTGDSGTVTNTMLAGSIANAKLSNSSITIGSTSVSLGATQTSLSGLTELIVDNLDFNGNEISSTNSNGDIILNPNGTGSVDVSGAVITNVGAPVNGGDAANKTYVDNAITGLAWKQSVNLLANSNVALTGSTGTLIIDGHTALDSNDSGYRILLTNQSTATQNGIYVYSDNGSTYTLTRATDADLVSELIGASVFVSEGSTYGNTGWVQTIDYPDTFDDLVWVQFSGAGAYSAGIALNLTGTTFDLLYDSNSFSVNGSDQLALASGIAGNGLTLTSGVIAVGGTSGRITINSDSIDIASTYIGQDTITTVGTISSGTWNGTAIADAYVANDLTISGGTINNTPIGGTTASSGAFTTVSASGTITASGNVTGAGAATSTLDGFNIDGGEY